MWAGAAQEKMPPKIAFHGTRGSMQTKILSFKTHLAVLKSNWPLGCPWHDPAAPILPTAHTNFSPPSFPQSVSVPSGCCGVCKTPWRIKTGLHVKKWLHFQTTKWHHLPHLVRSPKARSEPQPVVLGTELHPDGCASVSAMRCRASAAAAGGGHGSSACSATVGTVPQDAESAALAAELEGVRWDGIFFSCCFSPVVTLFRCSSGSSSSSSNPAASQHHPPVIRGCVAPAQDASQSLGSTRRAT